MSDGHDSVPVNAMLILPNVDPNKLVFPVIVNSVNQPTIAAGFYGKVGFHSWVRSQCINCVVEQCGDGPMED